MLYQGEQTVLPLAQQYLTRSALDIVPLSADDYMPMLRRAFRVSACLFRFPATGWNGQKRAITDELSPFATVSHAYIMVRTATHTPSDSFRAVMPYINHICAPFLRADIAWGFSQSETLDDDDGIEIFVLLLRVRPSIFRTADELIAPYIHHHSTPPVGLWRIYGRYYGLLFTVSESEGNCSDEEPVVPLRRLVCDYSSVMNLLLYCEDDSPQKQYLDRLDALMSQLVAAPGSKLSNDLTAAECTTGFMEAYTIAHTSQDWEQLLRLKNISLQKCPYSRREIYDAFLQTHNETLLATTRIAIPYNGRYTEWDTIEEAVTCLLATLPDTGVQGRDRRNATLHALIRQMILYHREYRAVFRKHGLGALLDEICRHTHITENDTLFDLVATAMLPVSPNSDTGGYSILCRSSDHLFYADGAGYNGLQDVFSQAADPHPDDRKHIYIERVPLQQPASGSAQDGEDRADSDASVQKPQYAYNVFFSDEPFAADFQEHIHRDLPVQGSMGSRISEHIPSDFLPMLYACNDYILIADRYHTNDYGKG